MMEWMEWQPIYYDIVNRLGIDPEMDTQATQLLTDLLMNINPNPLLRILEQKIFGRTVVICGAG